VTNSQCKILDGLRQRIRRLAVPATIIGLGLLVPLSAAAGGVVTNCTEANLRAAMTGGGRVIFACDGAITLTNTITNTLNTALDGTGHTVTITGPQAFYVSSNSTLTMVFITITNCHSPKGAGVFNNGGTVNLTNVLFENNYANGSLTAGGGGAIYNLAGGRLNADNCTFSNNSAQFCYYCGPCLGGAIYNSNGAVTLRQCLFDSNAAEGFDVNPQAYAGNQGYGGAIYSVGSLAADSCSFIRNLARGGAGGSPQGTPFLPNGYPGGDGSGGAIYSQGALAVSRCLFESNSAAGGFGGSGSTGQTHATGGPGGYGNSGGNGIGGGVYGVGGALINCTFEGNLAVAGGGGLGGAGGTSTLSGTGGAGGNGGNGGNGSGGAIAGGLNQVNCTIAFNSAVAGYGGSGGPGGSSIGSTGPSGASGTNGTAVGGGVYAGVITNSFLVANSPASSWSGSPNIEIPGPDPNLGPLTNNGGPTLTMALLPGSLAIDAGDTSAAPVTDQRGFPRPAGAAVDIGAFEFGSMLPVLNIAPPSGNVLSVLVQGNSNQWCRLLISSNLSDWVPIATNQFGPAGSVTFQANWNSNSTGGFYRVVMP
jgi:hypothetical protein